MSKEKKRSVDENEKKETLFYYEIIGVIIIIFSITILGKFGKIGNFFTTFFKCCFGNWYWLFLLFFLFLGIYNLFLHRKFDFKSSRFIGFIFIGVGILMFAHFPLHNYAISDNGNYFSKTWEIYSNYMNNGGRSDLGGGIVGSILFYAIYYLFGVYGVILIAILIILLGFSLIINKSILDIFKFFTHKAKNVGDYSRSFANFFKYELGKVDKKKIFERKDVLEKDIILPIKLLDDLKIMNDSKQDIISLDNKNTIVNLLNIQNAEYKFLSMKISFKVTTYKILLYSQVDIKKIVNRVQDIVNGRLLFSMTNGVLTIQIPNTYYQILILKDVLLRQSNLKNNYIIPLGININNELVEGDLSKYINTLVIGAVNSGIRNFINSLIISLLIKNPINHLTFKIYDTYDDFTIYDELFYIKKDNVLNFLDEIINDIDLRNDCFSKYNVYNFNEYNHKVETGLINDKIIKKEVVIINHINIKSDIYNYFENKLMYINQNSKKTGINIFLIARNDKNINNIIMSIFDNKIFFKCDKEKFSSEKIGNECYFHLLGSGDAIVKNNDFDERIQTPEISIKEIKKCLEFYK